MDRTHGTTTLGVTRTTLTALALTAALLLSPAARAGLVAEDSFWHADPTTRPVQLGLGFVMHSDLAALAPYDTDFVGPLLGLDLRAAYWLLPWLAVDAGATWAQGQDSGLFEDGSSRKWELAASAGATLALPLRLTPYGTARFGYGYQEIDWHQTGDVLGGGGTAADGTDRIHSFFFRGEVGALFHLTEYASLSLGMYFDVDLARDDIRTVSAESERDPVEGGQSEDAGLRRFGGQLSLLVRF